MKSHECNFKEHQYCYVPFIKSTIYKYRTMNTISRSFLEKKALTGRGRGRGVYWKLGANSSICGEGSTIPQYKNNYLATLVCHHSYLVLSFTKLCVGTCFNILTKSPSAHCFFKTHLTCVFWCYTVKQGFLIFLSVLVTIKYEETTDTLFLLVTVRIICHRNEHGHLLSYQ